MSTLGSSWRGSKFNWVELGWEVRREVALSQHSKPIPFKYLSSQSPFIIVVVHLFGKYFLRIYCALGTQSISAVPSISCMQPTSSLVHSLANKTFTSVHSFLPCLTYTHLVSFTFSNSTLFFLITPMSTAIGSEELIRVNRRFFWDEEEGGKAMKISNLCLVYKRFPFMLHQISRHTPCLT